MARRRLWRHVCGGVLRTLAARGPLPCTLAVVEWADEEGARFGHSLFGSSAVAGTLNVAEVRSLPTPGACGSVTWSPITESISTGWTRRGRRSAAPGLTWKRTSSRGQCLTGGPAAQRGVRNRGCRAPPGDLLRADGALGGDPDGHAPGHVPGRGGHGAGRPRVGRPPPGCGNGGRGPVAAGIVTAVAGKRPSWWISVTRTPVRWPPC